MPPKKSGKAARYTTADLAAMADLKAATITPEEIEHFTHFAETMGERYTLRNRFLIWMQRPTATYVNGFHTWKEHGRKVSKGQSGIAIIAPLKGRTENAEGLAKADGQSKDDKSKSKVWGVKVAWVWDITQTEPDDSGDAQEQPASKPGPAPDAAEITEMLETFREEETAVPQ